MIERTKKKDKRKGGLNATLNINMHAEIKIAHNTDYLDRYYTTLTFFSRPILIYIFFFLILILFLSFVLR